MTGLFFIPILSQPGWLRIPRTKSLHSTCPPTQPQASQQLSNIPHDRHILLTEAEGRWQWGQGQG